jgi:AAA15 family ATPase/GTPase
MDNDQIEKYKREVEQNQMREQGLSFRSFFSISYFLSSAFKKNALLDEIRKGIHPASSL